MENVAPTSSPVKGEPLADSAEEQRFQCSSRIAGALSYLLLLFLPSGGAAGTGLPPYRDRVIVADFNGAVSIPGSQLLATAGADGSAKLWNIQTGKAVQAFVGHNDSVSCIAASRRGDLLATGSHDHTVRLWNIKTGKTLQIFSQSATGWVNSLSFSPDGKILLILAYSGTSLGVTYGNASDLELWDLQKQRVLYQRRVVKPWQDRPIFATFSPNKKLYGVVLMDGRISVEECPSGHVVQSSPPTESEPVLAFSPDGKMLANSTVDGVNIREIPSLKIKRTLPFSRAISLNFSPDGRTLVTGEVYSPCKLWDVRSGRELRSFEIPLVSQSVVISSDGRTLVMSGYGIVIRDLRTGRELHRLMFQQIVRSTISPSNLMTLDCAHLLTPVKRPTEITLLEARGSGWETKCR